MSELPQDLTKYGRKHRNAGESFQNGAVELVGKREKKWQGLYNDRVAQPDGSFKWQLKRKILGSKAEIPTKGKAEELLREWLRARASQPQADTSQASFRAVAEDYFTLRQGKWSKTWRTTVRGMYTNVLLPALGDRAIKDLTAEDLQRFLNSLTTRTWHSTKWTKKLGGEWGKELGMAHTGISESYMHKIITKLREIFALALYKKITTSDPTRDFMMRLEKPLDLIPTDKTVLPAEDLQGLLAELGHRDRMIVWISMLGGPRPNELFALYARNVGNDRLYLENALDRWRNLGQTKSRKGRQAMLPPMLVAELQEWIEQHHLGPDDLVFANQKGKPLSRSNVLKHYLRRAAGRAGIKTQDVDFQMLRRSFTTAFVAIGGDVKSVQGQLGHARPDITILEYAQVVDPHRAAVLADLELMFRGLKPWPHEARAAMLSKQGAALIQ